MTLNKEDEAYLCLMEKIFSQSARDLKFARKKLLKALDDGDEKKISRWRHEIRDILLYFGEWEYSVPAIMKKYEIDRALLGLEK